jgi:hypothetical protein
LLGTEKTGESQKASAMFAEVFVLIKTLLGSRGQGAGH